MSDALGPPAGAYPAAAQSASDLAGRAADITQRLAARFAAQGFAPCDPPVLGPADPLFALYGEEIWDRAFVVEDVDAGQLCLRPDFTAPAARAHLAAAAGTPRSARLSYAGPVFRRTPQGGAPGASGAAAAQHLQVGVEIFDAGRGGGRGAGDPQAGRSNAEDAARDAETYRVCADALRAAGCGRFDVVAGDLGVVFSLLDVLDLPDAWRRRLRRHIWRPERFRELLNRFTGAIADGAPKGRTAFLAAVGAMPRAEAILAVQEMIALSDTPQIGVRGPEDVAERYLALAADARSRPMPAETAALLEQVLGVSAPLPAAADRIAALARAAGVSLDPALDRLSRRVDAMRADGTEVDAIAFDADFGRNLEYYDGFVFEMSAPNPGPDAAARPRLKLGGGGRYDRLFTALAAAEPALAAAAEGLRGVGLAVRPEAMAEAVVR